MLFLKKTKKFGRGVYTDTELKAGDFLEASPVVILDAWESKRVVATILNNYVFEWDGQRSALALGLGSIFNHSKNENVTYIINHQNQTIDFRTTRDIKKGGQLFVDYGYSVREAVRATQENKGSAQAYERK